MEPFETHILKRMLVQIGGIIAIAAILGAFVLAYNATYNTVVNFDQVADGRLGKVAGDLQERYHGIPGLAHDLRPLMGTDTSSLDNLMGSLGLWNTAVEAGDTGKISRATTNLEKALSTFISDLKGHPDIASSREVRDFMGVLETTEARTSADQVSYNEGVRQYNLAISSFPASLWAENWKFSQREYFTAEIGSRMSPPVPPN